MMSNGVRRNLGDPTGFPSLTEYRRTIEKKGVETTRWKSDQFIVEENVYSPRNEKKKRGTIEVGKKNARDIAYRGGRKIYSPQRHGGTEKRAQRSGVFALPDHSEGIEADPLDQQRSVNPAKQIRQMF